MSIYDRQFFAELEDEVRSSAAVIVPILTSALRPSSVVDVGCGTGTWLAAFQSAGVIDVLGVDGDYVDRAALNIPVDRFRPADLSALLRLDRSFDLAISLEVAEHLPPDRSESFVDDLTRLAPAVCFSAAIPLQGGVDHVNERWQDEWAALFARHGYRPVDLVRKQVWDDQRVMPWYAQNMLLYVEAGIDLVGNDLPLRLVHPVRYVDRVNGSGPLSVRQLAREALRTAGARLRKAGRSA